MGTFCCAREFSRKRENVNKLAWTSDFPDNSRQKSFWLHEIRSKSAFIRHIRRGRRSGGQGRPTAASVQGVRRHEVPVAGKMPPKWSTQEQRATAKLQKSRKHHRKTRENTERRLRELERVARASCRYAQRLEAARAIPQEHGRPVPRSVDFANFDDVSMSEDDFDADEVIRQRLKSLRERDGIPSSEDEEELDRDVPAPGNGGGVPGILKYF